MLVPFIWACLTFLDIEISTLVLHFEKKKKSFLDHAVPFYHVALFSFPIEPLSFETEAVFALWYVLNKY